MARTCPKHPESETMVPCLGCGRYFCRLCDPPSGAGQYCPRCYHESVSRLSGEEEEPRRSMLTRLKSLFEGGRRAAAAGGTETPGRPRERGIMGPGGVYPLRKLPGRLSEGAAAWWGRARSAGRRRFASALERVKTSFIRAFRATGRFIGEHQPLTLREREIQEGMPPLTASWLNLTAVVTGGAALWIAVVWLVQYRSPAVSVAVALLVAAGVAWTLGARFSISVGVATCMFALLSLVAGELVVLLLFRFHVISELDVFRVSLRELESPGIFYGLYFKRLILHRLLPSAAVAFFIGWWPLLKRPGWRGFNFKGGR